MIIQNLADSITANPEFFSEWDTHKRNNVPLLADEYFIVHTAVDDYSTRISVLDEDQNPIVTAVVDVYDDHEEAELQLSFVGSISDTFLEDITDAQLRAILEGYDLFMAEAQFPVSGDFDDLRLLKNLFRYLQCGKTVEEYFTPPAATRKNSWPDRSQNRFRATATAIAELFQAAS
jgi:hypothetical protein